MIIDVHVSRCLESDIKETMFGKGFQHVVKEGDRGRHCVEAGAIKMQGKIDFGFTRVTYDFCVAFGHKIKMSGLNIGQQDIFVSDKPFSQGSILFLFDLESLELFGDGLGIGFHDPGNFRMGHAIHFSEQLHGD